MAPPEPNGRSDDDGDLLKYVLVVYRRRRLVAGLCCASVLLTVITCLLLPKTYEATATVISPQEGSLEFSKLLALGGAGAAEAIGGFSLPSLTPHRDLFVSLLESRTLREQVVADLDLASHYEVEKPHLAERWLRKRTHVSVSKEGVISVRIEDRHAEVAARIANSYIENLDRRLTGYSTGDASRQRKFLEERLEKTAEELRLAEEAQRAFQEKHKIVAIEEQIKGSAEAAAELRTKIALLETQLEMWRSYVAEENPEFRKLETLLRENKRQLAKLQYGKGLILPPEVASAADPAASDGPLEAAGEQRHEIHVPFSEIPEVGLELARLSRDVVTKTKVYALLVAELEKARISESRDMPVIQVLDRAVPATRKSRPRTLINLILAGSTSLFLGILLALLLEYWKHLKRELTLRQEVVGHHDEGDNAAADDDDDLILAEAPPRTRLSDEPQRPEPQQRARRQRTTVKN